MPIAALILSLVGMALGIQPPRTQQTWGIGLSATFGMGVFVLYYGVLSIGIAMSEANRIDPILALWIPNAVLAGLGAYAIWKVGTEQWQSVTQGIQDFFGRYRFFRRAQ